MTRQRILRVAVAASLIVCVLGAGYLFRCWQLSRYTSRFSGESYAFFLAPSVVSEPHFHLSVDTWPSGAVIVECVHVWRGAMMRSTVPDVLPSPQFEEALSSCRFLLDPEIYGPFEWVEWPDE